MQKQLSELSGKKIRYNGMYHEVIEAKIVNHKAVIKTNRQTFVKTESELTVFVDGIEIIDRDLTPEAVKKEWLPSNQVAEKASSLRAEIIQAESTAQKVSNKLMEVFDLLSENPTEETYKKAAAMVNVSNSIVNVQMAQIKFLTLKK